MLLPPALESPRTPHLGVKDPPRSALRFLHQCCHGGGGGNDRSNPAPRLSSTVPSQPAPAACLHLALEPRCATLEYSVASLSHMCVHLSLSLLSGLTQAKGGGQQLGLLGISRRLPCPALFWSGLPLAGCGSVHRGTPVPCSVPSTVLNLGKRGSRPPPAGHLLSSVFPLCFALGARVWGAEPLRCWGWGGLQPEKMRLRDIKWLPSGLASHRENTSQEEEPQMCLAIS